MAVRVRVVAMVVNWVITSYIIPHFIHMPQKSMMSSRRPFSSCTRLFFRSPIGASLGVWRCMDLCVHVSAFNVSDEVDTK